MRFSSSLRTVRPFSFSINHGEANKRISNNYNGRDLNRPYGETLMFRDRRTLFVFFVFCSSVAQSYWKVETLTPNIIVNNEFLPKLRFIDLVDQHVLRVSKMSTRTSLVTRQCALRNSRSLSTHFEENLGT